MSAPEEPIRVDELVARIRAAIRDGGDAAGDGGSRALAQLPNLRHSKDLREINRLWRTEPSGPIRSHRRWLGPFVVAAKRRFQVTVLSVLDRYFERERDLFASVARYANDVAREVERTAREAYEDDQRVVDRTEIFFEKLREDRDELVSRLERLERRVDGLLSRLDPASPPEARDVEWGLRSVDESRWAALVPALTASGPVFHLPSGKGTLVSRLVESGISASGWEPSEGSDAFDPAAVLSNASLDGARAIVWTDAEVFPPKWARDIVDAAYQRLPPGGLILVEAADPSSLEGLGDLAGRGLLGRSFAPQWMAGLLEEAGFRDVAHDALSTSPAGLEPASGEIHSRTLRAFDRSLREIERRVLRPWRYYALGVKPDASG